MYQLLIVDDQPDLVEDLVTNLNWSSINISSVYQAHSAVEALEILRMTPIDIVITDIRMPGLSGLDLIEAIRASWDHIKCILLSGYNDFEYAKRALQHQASDYLLKPVEDDELLNAVQRAIHELESRWNEISSHQKALASIHANLPILRSHLLNSLLRGDQLSKEQLEKKIKMVELPIQYGATCYMMLMRMEDYFYEQSDSDISLLEYAVCNIAEEIFLEDYYLWYVKDSYGYYVFLIMARSDLTATRTTAVMNPVAIEQKAAHLQHYVKLYLKGTISLVLSKIGLFPLQLTNQYDDVLSSFRQRIGSERDFLLTLNIDKQNEYEDSHSLSHLYSPPLLNHLLETGQWDAVDQKLSLIYEELEQIRGDSYEYILETYYSIVSSLSYSIHKNKLRIVDCLATEFNQLMNGPHFHTIAQLRSWTNNVYLAYKLIMLGRVQDSRTGIIQKVQEYASQHLAEASLQTIADQVYLNPSYLSKVYKLETGEGISEYLSRLKMETAAHLLRSSSDKIYEIAATIGYLKTSYFIKLFKDRYGVTPQEFRER